MGFQHITFEKQDGVARLTLNKPPLNVLDIAMMRELNIALEGLDDPGIKVLVFEAAEGSKAFSAGVDVSEHTTDKVEEMIEVFHRIFSLLDELEVPTVAIVDGAALGGGCELVLFCDMVIASERASFGQPEIQVGVLPPIAVVALPGIIGPKKTLEMVLTGDRIRAPEALQLGLVNKVVPLAELESTAVAWGRRILTHSPMAIRCLKAAFNAELDGQAGIQELAGHATQLFYMTEEAQEGRDAFKDKRPPDFSRFPWRP